MRALPADIAGQREPLASGAGQTARLSLNGPLAKWTWRRQP